MYKITSLVPFSYDASFNILNITTGFKSTGICPFNQSIFSADAFVASHIVEILSLDNLVDDHIQNSGNENLDILINLENYLDNAGVLSPSKQSSSTETLISSNFVTESKHEVFLFTSYSRSHKALSKSFP